MDPRVYPLHSAPVRAAGRYVLYWAQHNRRTDSNHALLRAIERANELRLPVLFYEELACDAPFASDRHHTFTLEGVPETARRAARLGLGYCFHLQRTPRDPRDVLDRLSAQAAVTVTDDYPGAATTAAEAVDSSCVVPMRFFDKKEYAAYTLRPKLRRLLPQYLAPAPAPRVAVRWHGPAPAFHTEVTPERIAALAASCAIDHSVPPSTVHRGGRLAAEARLRHFLKRNLRRYAREKNEPAAKATSQLSPYLHSGHLSALEVACAVRKYAAEHKLIADEFLEELIVRRELAFNHALHSPQPAALENLPDWARRTLAAHAGDARDYVYTRDDFERAGTHDALWNAAQRELLLRGTIHGYYRMYWGKKIVEWSETVEEARTTMVHLNDRYAVDGRSPNGWTNILWCLGLHDRPWGERAVFGMVRTMSLEGMRRKTNVDAYLREIGELERGARA